ncbi:hypothetical protein [Holospora curviuscula]|uniref:Uncharacterized protein n=1 Tax=Holospora curviuscula TaxID=1082868 RepID=A0A2S5R9E3_9PROT|nr:hypothetical protein [Holospora curviuscula]PPE03913.1 hypothetical protein HCUR_00693 [Holospora curviuscula]
MRTNQARFFRKILGDNSRFVESMLLVVRNSVVVFPSQRQLQKGWDNEYGRWPFLPVS